MIQHINPPRVRMAWACPTFVLALAGAVLGAGVAARADMVVSLNTVAMAFDQAFPPRDNSEQNRDDGATRGSETFTASHTAVASVGRAHSSVTAIAHHKVKPDGLRGKLDYASSTQGMPYTFFSPFGS